MPWSPSLWRCGRDVYVVEVGERQYFSTVDATGLCIHPETCVDGDPGPVLVLYMLSSTCLHLRYVHQESISRYPTGALQSSLYSPTSHPRVSLTFMCFQSISPRSTRSRTTASNLRAVLGSTKSSDFDHNTQNAITFLRSQRMHKVSHILAPFPFTSLIYAREDASGSLQSSCGFNWRGAYRGYSSPGRAEHAYYFSGQ
jgi:hypothetical protein